jgi:hypothetical protein
MRCGTPSIAFQELAQTESSTLKWLFPQEKATFYISRKVYMYS